MDMNKKQQEGERVDVVDYHGTPLVATEHAVMVELERLIGAAIPKVEWWVEYNTFGFTAAGGHVTEIGLYNEVLSSLPATIMRRSKALT